MKQRLSSAFALAVLVALSPGCSGSGTITPDAGQNDAGPDDAGDAVTDIAPLCPDTCAGAEDCSACPGADLCQEGRCAECATSPDCAGAGEMCVRGVCVAPCGTPNAASSGTCGVSAGGDGIDEDCMFCGDSSAGWSCESPLAGDEGTCTPPAESCAELPGAILPSPWSATATCVENADCAEVVSGPLDIGALLIARLGRSDVTVLGETTAIQSVEVRRPAPVCAGVTLPGDLSCGVCAPCASDADCAPIPLREHAGELLQPALTGPSLDAFFQGLVGEDAPQVHQFCQPLGETFGVCRPCADPLHACGEAGR